MGGVDEGDALGQEGHQLRERREDPLSRAVEVAGHLLHAASREQRLHGEHAVVALAHRGSMDAQQVFPPELSFQIANVERVAGEALRNGALRQDEVQRESVVAGLRLALGLEGALEGAAILEETQRARQVVAADDEAGAERLVGAREQDAAHRAARRGDPGRALAFAHLAAEGADLLDEHGRQPRPAAFDDGGSPPPAREQTRDGELGRWRLVEMARQGHGRQHRHAEGVRPRELGEGALASAGLIEGQVSARAGQLAPLEEAAGRPGQVTAEEGVERFIFGAEVLEELFDWTPHVRELAFDLALEKRFLGRDVEAVSW